MLPTLLLLLAPQFVSSHARTVPEPAAASAGVVWTVPKAWTAVPSPSSMRLATYRLPTAAGDAEQPELAVFYFGVGQGGSVESNVERWLSQLAPEKGAAREPAAKRKVNGLDVTVVRAEGTYSSGMPGGPLTPRPGWALLGAIAEGPKGAVFFKLTGPKKSVAAARRDFDGLVAGLRGGP